METLVVVAEQRGQYYGRDKFLGRTRFASYSSRNFRDINCRTFQSVSGILSTPLKGYSTPLAKRASYAASPSSSSSSSSQKTPSPTLESHSFDKTLLTKGARSSPIPITKNGVRNGKRLHGFHNNTRSFSYSELWAGPAYSNSPPPSSVPIPKFSLPQKRSLSLELPASEPVVRIQPLAKSAPASPIRGHDPSAREIFCDADSATKTLRRILNLDDADE